MFNNTLPNIFPGVVSLGANVNPSTSENNVDINNVSASNAVTYLTTPTYDGSGQVVHPDIYYNADGWNGYKYWMGMTPYPASNDIYENPSILVSNDGNIWSVPAGLTNPLDTPATGHHSDTDIFMGHDNKLWLIFRWTNNSTDIIYATSSSDGINWSEKVAIMTYTVSTEQCLSPSVVVEDSGYSLYYVDWVGIDGKVKVKTSSTVTGTWSDATLCTITGMEVGKYVWHLDVLKYGTEYHALIVTAPAVANTFSLNFAVSTNGIDWTIKTTPIISPSVSGWDNAYIYRATFVLMNDGGDDYYDCWYSAKSSVNNIWRIGKTRIYIFEDTISPFVTEFIIPATVNNQLININSFIATDNRSVTGYLITESSAPPLVDDIGWLDIPPTSFECATSGVKTLYAWAKDGAGNVSTYVSAQTEITLSNLSNLTTGLLSVWEADETTGSILNDSHGTINGNIVGATINQTGKINKAISFNGTSNYITFGDVFDFEHTQPFSLSIWYNTLGSSNIRVLFGKQVHSSPNNGWNLLLNSGKIQFQMVNKWASNYLIVDSLLSSYNDTGWKHLVVTYAGDKNPANVKMYINGIEITTTIAANTLTGSILNNIPFTLGTRNNNAYYWSGLMDQTAIWDKALTIDEIQTLYNSDNGKLYSEW